MCFIIECVVRGKEEEVMLVCVSHTHIIHVDVCGQHFALVLSHHWNPKDYQENSPLFCLSQHHELQKCSSGFSHFKLFVVELSFPPAFFSWIKRIKMHKGMEKWPWREKWGGRDLRRRERKDNIGKNH